MCSIEVTAVKDPNAIITFGRQRIEEFDESAFIVDL